MSEKLTFSLERTIIPIEIDGSQYELREATGQVAANYRNSMLQRVKLDEKGKPTSLGNIADLEVYLVSMCLYSKDTGKRVDEKQIKKEWPAKVLKALHKKAMEISELDEDVDMEELTGIQKETDPAKKGQSSTVGG